ncbi:MAG: T9SS type A sorting domain-containing protein [Psychroflexus sp.]|nr:T9SS type A sorting domain-containing protein [Psychroflexus sp.]
MKNIIIVITLLFSSTLLSQTNFWTQKNLNNVHEEDIINYDTQVSIFNTFELNEGSLINTLQNAPKRFQQFSSDVLITIPYDQNNFGVFEMFEVQTFAPELANKYPNIKSYVGKHRGQNADRLRLTVTPHGIYVKVYRSAGSIYINPMTKNASFYKVFKSENAVFPPAICDFEFNLQNEAASSPSASASEAIVDDSTFRIYRLAAAANGEYSTFHINQAGVSSGTTAQKKSAVLAAMTVSLDRVNGILENDLSINLEFIPTTDNYIFLDPATDPYSNPNSTSAILTDNNNFMPGAVGDANYDIGHVYTTAPGGVAFVGALCNDNIKAGGVTGSSSPVGDGFDLILAHEFGHQLGASHTFNNFCGGNRSDNSVYEAGSGVTIMSYAGICSPNIQGNRYDHYHAGSLIQMFNVISNTSCAQTSTISNDPPVITPDTDYTIPRQTPFVLEAQASDPNNDALTYTWEQFDNDLGAQPPVASSTEGPLFRGFRPQTTSKRYFPRLETVLNNQNQTTWEVLPNVTRTMDFVVTARDNNIVGGQSEQDLVVVDVNGAAGPFAVTSQSTTGISWDPGTTETITWNVAGTDANGINASEVDILLSTNAGVSFDHVLAQNTPNDGTESITVPFGVVGDQSRIMVKASDNIFFSVNDEFISVNANCDNVNNSSTINIPDGMGFVGPMPGTPAESVINIPLNDQVASVSLSVQLSHARLNDVEVELESPDGQIVQLWDRDLCNADGINLTFVEGGSPLPVSNCEDTVEGFYQPVGNLTDFVGASTNGDWTLRVTDFFVGNEGSIDSWSIEVCAAEFLNSEGFEQDLFSLFPNPAENYVTLQFNQSTNNTTIYIFDISGRLVKAVTNSESLSTQKIDVNQLSAGTYIVKVNQGNRSTVKKLIIN